MSKSANAIVNLFIAILVNYTGLGVKIQASKSDIIPLMHRHSHVLRGLFRGFQFVKSLEAIECELNINESSAYVLRNQRLKISFVVPLVQRSYARRTIQMPEGIRKVAAARSSMRLSKSESGVAPNSVGVF
jgi:hypothetical protein